MTETYEPSPPPMITPNLDGKVAIVTGGGSRTEGIGNGRAAALLLAASGVSVVVADRLHDAAQKTVDMIEAAGGTGHAVAGDVADEADCARIAEEAKDRFGGIDILVNNVGVGGPWGNALDLDLEDWARAMTINVTSMVMMARHCVPSMKERGGGSIVNVSSVAGLRGGQPVLLYPTSKGAVVNMTRAMAVHHGPDGIRVNCVCPGMLFTPMVYNGGMTEELREARRQRSILRTEGNGWDAGAAIAFLASDMARWITGVILPVDAGVTAMTAAGAVHDKRSVERGMN